jgi:predicted nuclease of predicted toxin-antitoxin system
MRLVVDMNLSPDWVTVLTAAGHDAVHWSTVGNIRAADREIMAWARQEHRVVFTHDLDFGTILALTQEAGPSVLQVRTQDVAPAAIGEMVVGALSRFQRELEEGAIVVLDEARQRVRILPLK